MEPTSLLFLKNNVASSVATDSQFVHKPLTDQTSGLTQAADSVATGSTLTPSQKATRSLTCRVHKCGLMPPLSDPGKWQHLRRRLMVKPPLSR
jgi:hypothetical protein